MKQLSSLLKYHRHNPRSASLKISAAILGGLLILGTQSLLGGTLQAQTAEQATVTQILDGNEVYIQNRQAQVRSIARRQQQVRTGNARTELLFNTGAIARLTQNSSLTVGACAQLNQGTLLVNGNLAGCTNSIVAGVRGTRYSLRVESSAIETVEVFEGSLEVRFRDGGEQALLGSVASRSKQFNGSTGSSPWPYPNSERVMLPAVVDAGQGLLVLTDLGYAYRYNLNDGHYARYEILNRSYSDSVPSILERRQRMEQPGQGADADSHSSHSSSSNF